MIINHDPPSDRKEQLVKEFREKHTAVFTWTDGNQYHASLDVLPLIIGQVAVILINTYKGISSPDVRWKTASGQIVTMTADTFLQFALDLSNHIRQVYETSWQF